MADESDRAGAEDVQAAAWLAAAGRGDLKALEALFDVYHRPLYRILSRILGDRRDTEEVVQDTFVRLATAGQRYDARKARPFHYIVVIGRNLAIDRMRRLGRGPMLLELEQNAAVMDQNANARPEAAAERESEMTRVTAQLAGLSEAQREAIDLAFRHGLSRGEIAQRLGRPEGTVKSDIRRGLQKLRLKLGGGA